MTGNATLESSLDLAGDARIEGSTKIDSSLSVTGATTLENTVAVAGESDLISAARLHSTLSVEGTADIKANTQLGGKLSVTGTTDVVGAAQLGSTLSVGGNVSIKANMYVDGPQMRVPKGALGGRPANSLDHALIYYNNDYKAFEGLAKIGDSGNAAADNVWMPLGGVIDHDQDSFIRAMDASFNDTDTLSFHADDAANARMTLDATSLEYNANHDISAGRVKLNSSLSVAGAANLEDMLKIKANLSVKGATKLDSTATVMGATDLRSTLSVRLDGAFEKDLRMANNTGIFQVAQHNDDNTYGNKYKAGSNVGAIVYDRTLQVHMGLQGNSEIGFNWMPLTGVRDVDGDTTITSESSPGADEDTLTFSAEGEIVATMTSNDFNIDKALSVGAVTNFEEDVTVNANSIMDGTLSVSGTSKINGELTTNNNVVLNGTAANSTTVKGQSTFEQNVTVSEEKTLYAQNFMTETMGHYSQYNAGGEGRASGQLDMYYEEVKIHGDLNIMGQINQSATNVTELYVEDKSIVLGASSSSEVRSNADGTISYEGSNYTTHETAVHESGLKVSGVPDMFTTDADKLAASENKMYEKSLLWNVPGENNTGGTSNLALSCGDDSRKHLEPFWEFKGGQVRITGHTQNDEKEYVSFVFRINTKEQLELVKLTSTNANQVDGETSFKTIAKFGNVVIN